VLLLVALAPAALAANVKIRVEGKTTTIFGPTQPSVSAGNALQALDAASTAGEFYYGMTTSSFGDYVSQIGKYPASESTGWVFKVNGVSPPVGADAVTLKDGDRVLWYWATFGPTGGPPTLSSCPASRAQGGALTTLNNRLMPAPLAAPTMPSSAPKSRAPGLASKRRHSTCCLTQLKPMP